MPPRGRLPARPDYADLPFWPHNFDNVQTRIVNGAWNALFESDLEDLSFKTLAKGIGVTPQAVYHYYPSFSALGGELASRACLTLHAELTEPRTWDAPRARPLAQFIAQYVAFAERRRRHFALMFSPRFSDPEAFPGLAAGRMQLAKAIWSLLEIELGAEPPVEELQVFWGVIHGHASLIASGQVPQLQILTEACGQHLDRIGRTLGPK